MKTVTTYETIGGPGIFVNKTSSKYNTWAGSDNLEIETIITNLSIDQSSLREQMFADFSFKQKLAEEINAEMDIMLRSKVKEVIKEAIKLDVIIWKDEDGDKFTAQVIIDGDVCLEKTVQVAV